ncbi:unnamed protein product [Rhizophagus irregularis]|nr:unnamed protein product [Rhizophagus irregularis]
MVFPVKISWRHDVLVWKIVASIYIIGRYERYRTDIGPTPTICSNCTSSSPFQVLKMIHHFRDYSPLAYKLGLPRDVDISKVTLSDLEIFIDTELNKNLPSDHIYRGNQVFGISSGTRKPKKLRNAQVAENLVILRVPVRNLRKGKRKTNYAHDSSDPSDSSDSSNSLTPLTLLVQSFVNAVPKETVISAYNALNAEFINYKELVLGQLKGEPSIKTREKVWDNVKDLFTSILHPMISVVTNSMAANLIRKNDDVICNNDLWSSIAGIGIVNCKSASDVVTIKTKVVAPESEKSLVIPMTIFDTGSDSSLISNNIVKRLNLDVDRSNAPDLSGVATKSDTIGTVYGLGYPCI